MIDNSQTLFRSLIDTITYKDWSIIYEHPYIKLFIPDPEGNVSYTGKRGWYSRKWYISYHMTESEVIQTVFKAVMTAEEHETREKFLVEGVSVLGPHWDLISILDMAQSGKLKESVKK